MKLNKKGFIFIFSFIFIILLISIFTINIDNKKFVEIEKNNDNDKKETIKEVIKEDIVLQRPYKDDDIEIKKNYYNYKDSAEVQEKSILKFDNTYIQNNSIAYGKKDSFIICSILDGEVVNIKKDDLVGNIIEIKHDNNLVSIYQSIQNIKVKKGDYVKQGQEIAQSFNSDTEEMGNYFLFELLINNNIVNPENYLGKSISTISE